jgi:hypothetical protein
MASTNYRDKRFRKVQGGPVTVTNPGSTSVNQWFGETVMGSRHVFVAAPLVATTSRIRLDVVGYGTVNSGATATSFLVTSIQAGSGFIISTVNSISFGLAGTPSLGVWWELGNPR